MLHRWRVTGHVATEGTGSESRAQLGLWGAELLDTRGTVQKERTKGAEEAVKLSWGTVLL